MESKSLLDILVVDCGAHTIRAGRAEDFPAEEESPHIVLPSCVSEAGPNAEIPTSGSKKVFDSNGCIADWDGLECIFEHIFYEQLGWPEGDEGYVLCTENVPCMPRSSRERLTQTLFETFNVKGCYMLDSSIACLYAAGKVSGMTVDVGHTGTNVVQVRHPSGFKDVVPPHAIIQGLHANPRFYLIRDIVKESHVQVVDGAAVVGTSDRHAVGGAMLDELLQGFVINDGPAMSQQDLQSFKEKCAIAADSREEYVDVMEEKKSVETVEHTLPDGQTVKIGKDRYTLGESLLHPSSIPQVVQAGIQQTTLGVSEAALSCLAILSDSQQQQQQRQLMMDNILLCGGCSMMPHFGSRFMTELRGYFPSTTPMSKLIVPDYLPKRSARFAAYAGATIVAKTMTANHTMTKEEYEERGPGLMQKKC